MKFAKFLGTPFFKVFHWLLLRFTTRVFKGIWSKSRCDCQEYIPDSSEENVFAAAKIQKQAP